MEGGKRANPMPAGWKDGDGTGQEGGRSWADRVRGSERGTAAGAAGAAGGGAALAHAVAEHEAVRDDLDAEDEDGEDFDAQPAKSAAELRRDWDAAAETVRYLERRGGPRVPAAVLDSAKLHRDEAERAWRAVKQPHPVGKRLRWAAAALDDALAKEQAHRAELQEFEAEVAQRRSELQERQEADAARTAKRRRELDELREEAGADGTVEERCGRVAMEHIKKIRPTLWATRVAQEGINRDVGPALERALDNISEDSPAWLPLQGALAAVTGVLGVLDEAINDTGDARRFDMAAADGDGSTSEMVDSLDAISLPENAGGASAGGATNGGGAGSSADEGAATGAKRRALEGDGGTSTRWTRSQQAHGPWTRVHDTRSNEGGNAAAADQASGQLPNGGSSAAAAPSGGAGGTPGAASGAVPGADDVARKVEEATRRRTAEEAAERQRLEQALSPQERAQAQALFAQQAAASAVGFGSAQALEIAQRVHQDRLKEVVKLAREKDIPLVVAELQAMSAEELEDWAARHV